MKSYIIHMIKDTLNIKYIIYILIISLFFISPVSAYERIMQGGNVYLNETVDISGTTGWSDAIAYYHGYDEDGTPSYIYDISFPLSQEKFYIDPLIFWNRTGYWFQYDIVGTSNHAFTISFNVINGNRTKPIINITENITPVINTTIEIPIVKTKHIADYVVARGDILTIKTSTSSKVWIFGNGGGIYNKKSESGIATFNKSEINSLLIGSYKILIQYPGKNGEFNSVYDNKKKTLKTLITTVEGWNTLEEDVSIYSPLLLIDKVISSIGKTDDTYNIYDLNIDQPYIEILSRDSYDVAGNQGRIVVTGYTNSATGTNIDLNIDDIDFLNPKVRLITSTKALSTGNPGDVRYFIVTIPFFYDDLSPGTHFITARSSMGGKMTVEFHVYSLPDGSPPRNKTVYYIGGNEFIPTPTPEIIRVVETQVVEKIITQQVVVQLTPNLNELYDTNKQIQYETIIEIGGGFIALIIVIYIALVALRGRRD